VVLEEVKWRTLLQVICHIHIYAHPAGPGVSCQGGLWS
jgi:hypothetical protein